MEAHFCSSKVIFLELVDRLYKRCLLLFPCCIDKKMPWKYILTS
jgi:hypothetical protein